MNKNSLESLREVISTYGELWYQLDTKNGVVMFRRTSDGDLVTSREFSSSRSGNRPVLEVEVGKNNYKKTIYEKCEVKSRRSGRGKSQ